MVIDGHDIKINHIVHTIIEDLNIQSKHIITYFAKRMLDDKTFEIVFQEK